MKQKYRGCEVFSNREKCMGGWDQIYYGAYSPDGYEIEYDFWGVGNVREGLEAAKARVDEFLDEFDGDEDAWHDYCFS